MNNKIIIENLISVNEDICSGKAERGIGRLNFLINYLQDQEEKQMLIELKKEVNNNNVRK